jgi:hypothetical protein
LLPLPSARFIADYLMENHSNATAKTLLPRRLPLSLLQNAQLTLVLSLGGIQAETKEGPVRFFLDNSSL